MATPPAAGGAGGFDCVHMRRRDFLADHSAEEESVESYARRAAARLRRADGAFLPLYLASDVAEQPETLAAFKAAFGHEALTLHRVFPPPELDTFTSTPRLSQLSGAAREAALAVEMRLGNVDQLLCAQAEQFVGNKWSSFTHHVCALRAARGVPGACVGSDVYGREIDRDMEYV